MVAMVLGSGRSNIFSSMSTGRKEKFTISAYFLHGQSATIVAEYFLAKAQGLPSAQCNLADCYLKGIGVGKDKQEAIKWLQAAATRGYEPAQQALEDIEEEEDTPEAVARTRKAAELGDDEAQCNLGIRYYEGKGVRQDIKEAVKWYHKAAEQGNAKAQNNLGKCYFFGEGVPENKEEGIKWYRKAAEQGHTGSQYNLGVCYYMGDGVPEDKEEANKWFRKAAEQGLATAQFNLGASYAKGEGVPEDMEEAKKWFRKAAEQGHKRAINALETIK